MNNESKIANNEEFYHKDIFGAVVDIDFSKTEEEETALLPEKRGEFNVFSLTDAFGRRDKKEAWTTYQRALLSGFSAEEIFFKIFWQVKSMLVALGTESAGEADMKPFPYNKAKSFLKNFREDELKKISEDLVIGYYQARRGRGEIESLVEKILLKL